MTETQQDYAAAHYAPRAADYVTSKVHAQGPDLDQIAALLAGQGGAIVLDLGCGGGHVSFAAAPHVARVVAVDVTAAMLAQVAAQAKRLGFDNIETRQAPAEALPFADAMFDAVLCRFTAHHWQDLDAGLRQARRVLKPGGLALFIDTVAPAERVLDTHLQAMELLRDGSHVRNYSVAEWRAALAGAGLVVREVTSRSLRMEFSAWIARTRTPPETEAAILRLQRRAPQHIRDLFAIDETGSFDIEAASFRGV